MTSFDYTTAEDFKDIRFGACLLDIVEELKLPVPLIKGSLLKRFNNEGCWGVKAVQHGRDTEPKTNDIVINLVSDSMEKGLSIVMQELIGRLCGRHSTELKGHYSFLFGRRDEKGVPIELSEAGRKVVKRQRLHFQDLENHINTLEEESCFELLRNDELCGQLKEKDKKIQELEEIIKAQEEEFQAHDKKFQNQEKRVQKKNEMLRKQKQEIESNEVEFEADHNLIEKLRAEKRDLQEKNEELAKELKEYKAGFLEAGLTFEIVEEEVDVDEEAK
ncbi:uncharacterized protein [Lolium perenne]|uniref:uncharacterized protein n=1 Tax=Lolium perenne TaxID=4522 RepID=UPI003A995C3B